MYFPEHSKFILCIFSEIMISKCLPRGATIATGIGVDSRGYHVSIPGRDKRVLSSPKRSYQVWGPHSLLFNDYWGLFL
jgi:hypothetical protein